MSFVGAIQNGFRNYTKFKGRATRSEFWWWTLFSFLVQAGSSRLSEVFGTFVAIALFLPTVAVGVRRMHDVNRSGWWYVVPIVNIVLACWKSNEAKDPITINQSPITRDVDPTQTPDSSTVPKVESDTQPQEVQARAVNRTDVQKPSSYNFSPKDCAEAVGRAQEALSDPRAVGDINRRLRTRAVEVLAVVGACIGLDPESVGSSRGIPVMQLDKSVLDYLGLNPDDFAGINFAWTLGVANDTVLGPIPTLFLCSRYRTTDRIVALVWSLTKCTEPQWKDQRGHFNSLLIGEMEDISWPGAEGGHVAISELAIMVNRPSGGLDLRTQKHIMSHKIWAQLEMSLSHNATTRAFQDSAPAWPYPTDMSEDGVFDCPGAGQFKNWY